MQCAESLLDKREEYAELVARTERLRKLVKPRGVEMQRELTGSEPPLDKREAYAQLAAQSERLQKSVSKLSTNLEHATTITDSAATLALSFSKSLRAAQNT